MRVSVLLPVYNGETFLEAALDSLLSQEGCEPEILVVNDGSQDRTAEILEDYAGRHPNLRLCHRPHEGIVAALNAGVKLASGDLIARMDADDICHPQRLVKQHDFLCEHPEIGLVATGVTYGGDAHIHGGFATYVDWTNGLLQPEDIANNRFVESPLIHPSVMFRKELVRQWGGYRHGPFPEDYELWLRWLDGGVVMARLPKALVTWRERPDRLSRVDERYATEAFYQTKTHYLARYLRQTLRGRPIVVWGAGRVTRRRAELLIGEGLDIHAYIDVDPKKIGRQYQSREVWSHHQLPDAGELFVLSYVGSRGARKLIETDLCERGYGVGRDYLLVG